LKLILASASPRRRELLKRLGIEFEAMVPEVQELRGGDPERSVIENARRKAQAGLAGARAGSVALGVDTDVVLDDRALGKAASAAEARHHLETLSGRTHEVLSGIALLGPRPESGDPTERTALARSRVGFRALDRATIDLYLASGEWGDRAGAYAVQGLGSMLIERIEGDLSNVIGLPVTELLRLAPELLPTPDRGRGGFGWP
jgi:septum formation protein